MPYGQVTLNFKDQQGDLIQIVDESDMKLVKKYAAKLKRPGVKDPLHSTWAIYATRVGDYSPYNTHPYEKNDVVF